MEPESNWGGQRVFLDITIADRPIGRVIIELYNKICPKACENFRQFCTGEYRPQGVPLGYKNTLIHRIIPGFIIQGGDFDTRDGNGCMCIYGYTFEDEPSALSFNEPGVLAMANSGPNTNGCQFFITLSSTPSLEGSYVAFGKVVGGMMVLRQIEAVPLIPNSETPQLSVCVSDCGEY